MTNYRLYLAAAALLLLPAQAEECGKLISYGTIPLVHIDGHTSEFVQVEIKGVAKLMMVDTGAGVTVLSDKTASELQMEAIRNRDFEVYDVTGAKSNMFVKGSLKIGSLKGDSVNFMLGTRYLGSFTDTRVVGLLGADILAKFDVSLDFGAHTFTMFDQNHCDGQVVYWPERPLAIIPFRLVNGNQIVLPVSLDGREVKALLDTGAYRSTLEKTRAQGRFDLVLGSADTPAIGDDGGLPFWRHRFTTLSLAGIEVSNPEIDIIPDKISPVANNWSTGSLLDRKASGGEEPPMLLGMNVLKDLHIYIAYKEKKLYITKAGKPAEAATPAKTN